MIRAALPADAPRLAAIYAEQVLYGTATAEEVPPTPDEMAARLAAVTQGGHPWLVWQDVHEVSGYAYCRPYHARAAYRHTVENGVYIAPEARGRRVGHALLGALLTRAAAAGARQMVASITPQGGDASIALHTAHGFVERGRLIGIIEKFGRTLDCVYMQRDLAPAAPLAL